MKFCGKIGFYIGDEEVSPGIYKSRILERKYFGDIIRNNRRWQQTSNSQNDTLVSNNQISVVSDLYAQQNWSSIKYAIWNDAKLKVKSVDLTNYPRLTLEIGEVYNGQNEIVFTE